MAISNGFDETLIMATAITRLGFKTPYDSGYHAVSSANQQSDSGRYYNDFHRSVTAPNIQENQDYADISATDFNTELANLKRSVVDASLNAVFYEKQETDRAKMLFDVLPNSQNVTIPNTGNFVGWRIDVARGSFAAKINSLHLLFDGAATFNIYIFQDLKKAPIYTKSVTTVANDITTISLTTDYILRPVQTGTFYIGYFQSDLGSVHALDVSIRDYNCFKVVGFTGLQATATSSTDFQRYGYGQNYKTYGLNVEVSTYRDFTNEIVKNIHLFDNLQGLMMAAQVIELINMGVRSNGNERITGEQTKELYTDLNASGSSPDYPFVPGVKSKISKEVERLRQTFFPRKAVTTTPAPNLCCSANHQLPA